uniref:RNA-directed DNA polymerase n=1 Tax=Lygus hesperus TaxID=30085 RepID=A0A0A9W7L1_LYGHE
MFPPSFRIQAFHSVHGSAHPGNRATHKSLSQRFIWPSMAKDCKEWVRTCTDYQQNKVQRQIHGALGEIQPPSDRFSHIHIDLIGSRVLSQGYTYVFTCVDRFTHWPEVISLPDCKAHTVAQAFCVHWISRFGIPCKITSDRGCQFENTLFRQRTTTLGISHSFTSAYNPEANITVGRLHGQLKAAIR